MTLVKFKELLLIQKNISDKIHELYKNGIDLINFSEEYEKRIGILSLELFGEYGWDHISSFVEMYDENSTKENPMCWSEETKEPFYWDETSLFNYLVKQKYIKNE